MSTTLIEAWKVNRPKELAAKAKAEADAKKTGKLAAPALDQDVSKSSAVSISDRSFLSALLAGRGAGATPVGKVARLLTDSEVGEMRHTATTQVVVFFTQQESWELTPGISKITVSECSCKIAPVVNCVQRL